jgi:hypothetical protein
MMNKLLLLFFVFCLVGLFMLGAYKIGIGQGVDKYKETNLTIEALSPYLRTVSLNHHVDYYFIGQHIICIESIKPYCFLTAAPLNFPINIDPNNPNDKVYFTKADWDKTK